MIKDIMEKMYSKEYQKKYKWLLPLLFRLFQTKDTKRFIILAKACLTCDTYEDLTKIKCPIYVIGGKEDRIVTAEASLEIAEQTGAPLYLYENLGHAAHEEAKDFYDRIYRFLEV